VPEFMSPTQALSDVFRGALAPGVSAQIRDDVAHLEEVLGELLEAGRRARPSISVPREAFITYLAERVPPTATSVDALRELRAEDLYLACACVLGDTSAIALFDAAYMANIGSLIPLPAGTSEGDVKQAVREKLFLGRDGGAPKISDYSGRGDLAGWVRVVAVRTSLNLARGKKREVAFDEDELLADRAGTGPDDAELGHLKKLYRNEFREAFRQALAVLSVRHRNMLRQHYIDGLPMEKIGSIYQVHRITVVRQMKEARKELAAETRRRLKAKLRVSRGELDSIMRLIQSHFDVSLRACLPDDEGR
jgi:RNA polymerase sigma-70 factor (ECF subfamily)